VLPRRRANFHDVALVRLHQRAQTEVAYIQLVPFSRPIPGPDPRHGRDFGRQRARDPAETDSLAEQSGFEPLVPLR
jgi:hypothetical protein